jgi:hypothetical protein
MAAQEKMDTHIYMAPALYKKVKAAAKTDRRSVTAWIVMQLEAALRALEGGRQ